MELQQQVVNLELSKRMKELGFKQESLFWWIKGEMVYGYEGEWSIKESNKWFLFDHQVGIKFNKYNFDVDAGDMGSSDEEYLKWEKRQNKLRKEIMKTIYPAYTVAELGEMLPAKIKDKEFRYLDNWLGVKLLIGNEWQVGYWKTEEESSIIKTAKTEADARAKMLIYLKENNLL